MRKALLAALCLVVFVSAAFAEGKLESKWHCGKPSAEKSLEIGDAPGHMYAIAQGTCEATASSVGEKTGVYTESQEVWKDSYTSRGTFVVTTGNGDKMYDTYEQKGDLVKKTVTEHWKAAGGTGKHKGATGSGTCTATLHDDGTSDWECRGTISSVK